LRKRQNFSKKVKDFSDLTNCLISELAKEASFSPLVTHAPEPKQWH
jgi:hypothetical protein